MRFHDLFQLNYFYSEIFSRRDSFNDCPSLLSRLVKPARLFHGRVHSAHTFVFLFMDHPILPVPGYIGHVIGAPPRTCTVVEVL